MAGRGCKTPSHLWVGCAVASVPHMVVHLRGWAGVEGGEVVFEVAISEVGRIAACR